MDKGKKTMEYLYHAMDCVQYFHRISKLPNCNTCGKKDTCPHVPKPGESVRINCFDWKKKGD